MINWIRMSGKRNSSENDLSIYYGNNGDVVKFKFSEGCIATKFRHKERIEIGVDNNVSKIYFLPGDDGYKITKPGRTKTGYVIIQTSKVEKTLRKKRAGELIGDYSLQYDEEEKAWFVPIGAYQG